MAIGSLAVRVSSDTTSFNQSMASAGGTAKRFGSEASDVGKKVATMGAAVVAAGVAIGAELTRRGLEAVDAQAKLSRQLGGTIDGLRSLQIAGSDAGVASGVLSSAMEKLNSRLGEARRGSGSAYDSFERLGLSAEELAGMDVDERLATIADRMRGLGLSTDQAGDELRQMGIRNGEMVNLMLQGGDAIRSARGEVDSLGLSISQVDAAKVEIANDAFARTGLMLEALSQRMAVEVAPILTALSDLFVESAGESNSMAETVSDGMGGIVSAIGFVLDAGEGVNRTFEVAGKGVALMALGGTEVMLSFADTILNAPVAAVNELIEAFNKIPGIDIEPVGLSGMGASIRSELETVRGAIQIAQGDIHDTIMAPLPSLQFEAFVAKAKEDAEVAAQEMVGLGEMLRPDIGGEYGGGSGGTEEEGKEAERKRKELAAKLEAIREANLTERELTLEKYALENDDLSAALEQQLITREEWAAMAASQKDREEKALTDIEKDASDARTRLAQQEARAKQQAMSSALGNMSTLMNSESEKMFKIGKAAALAGALVDGYAAITGAYKVGASIGGPYLGAAYGVAAGAATMAQINSIRSTSFNGGGGSASGGSAGMSNTAAINQNGQAVQGQSESSRNMYVQGIDPNQMFSGRQLVELINEAQQDGAQLRIGTA